MSEAFRLYKITDPMLTHIGNEQITEADRRNGILLRPSEARFYVSNGKMRPFDGTSEAIIPPRPIVPKKLSEIFAPALDPEESGESYLLRSVKGELVLVAYVPPPVSEPDEPDEGDEPPDIGDVAQVFRAALN